VIKNLIWVNQQKKNIVNNDTTVPALKSSDSFVSFLSTYKELSADQKPKPVPNVTVFIEKNVPPPSKKRSIEATEPKWWEEDLKELTKKQKIQEEEDAKFAILIANEAEEEEKQKKITP